MKVLLTGNDVVAAVLLARKVPTPANRAKATRLLNEYVHKRAALGLNPVMVEAGIRARVTRILNTT